MQAIGFVDRLLQASRRVVDLNQPMASWMGAPRYIGYGGVLRELMELGFEGIRSIVRGREGEKVYEGESKP